MGYSIFYYKCFYVWQCQFVDKGIFTGKGSPNKGEVTTAKYLLSLAFQAKIPVEWTAIETDGTDPEALS